MNSFDNQSVPSARVPVVSVVMAVYNGEMYVRQAIDSILHQTFTDFELVLVNDGSSDDTPRILASYHDSRIVLVENTENLGLTKSLNRGIRASRGEFVARQDADDLSLPDRLARQVSFMKANPMIGLVGSSSRWIDELNTVIREWRPLTEPAEIQKVLLSSIPFLHGTFMLRRECLEETGGGYNPAMPVAQDCDLLLQISERWDLANLPEVLYIHRRHENTVTVRRGIEQEQCLQLAKRAAIQRRLDLGWGRLGLSRAEVPEWVRSADRRWLSRRFVWWSAGARQMSRKAALKFAFIALLLDPAAPEVWEYARDFVVRKISLIGSVGRGGWRRM